MSSRVGRRGKFKKERRGDKFEFLSARRVKQIHQSKHFSIGFIVDPRGQLKASENAGKFAKDPNTRIGAGEWALCLTSCSIASG